MDVKERNGKAYVLEVNDNPSIDHGVENDYLGDELYMIVMAEFRRRLENRGLKVEIDGFGKVVRQSIRPGTKARGQTVRLVLG